MGREVNKGVRLVIDKKFSKAKTREINETYKELTSEHRKLADKFIDEWNDCRDDEIDDIINKYWEKVYNSDERDRFNFIKYHYLKLGLWEDAYKPLNAFYEYERIGNRLRWVGGFDAWKWYDENEAMPFIEAIFESKNINNLYDYLYEKDILSQNITLIIDLERHDFDVIEYLVDIKYRKNGTFMGFGYSEEELYCEMAKKLSHSDIVLLFKRKWTNIEGFYDEIRYGLFEGDPTYDHETTMKKLKRKIKEFGVTEWEKEFLEEWLILGNKSIVETWAKNFKEIYLEIIELKRRGHQDGAEKA